MRALFVGRFQPFHNGHLRVLRDIHREFDEIAIVVCGPSEPDGKNPFTFEERKEMINRALKGKGIHCTVHGIEDVNDDGKWAGEIMKMGTFDAAYSRNPWTIRCLLKAGIDVRRHEFYARARNAGTQIRKNMLEGKEWKQSVPVKVYEYIKEINGEERLTKK